MLLAAASCPAGRSSAARSPTSRARPRRAGVAIVTGVARRRRDWSASGRPDVVVVATGAVPYRPPLELDGDPVVLDAWDVIRGRAVPDGHVVVADWRSRLDRARRRDAARRRGRRVTLASSATTAGPAAPAVRPGHDDGERRRARVDLRPTLRPYGADATAVFLQHVLTGEAVVVEDVAALVLAQGPAPLDALLAS